MQGSFSDGKTMAQDTEGKLRAGALGPLAIAFFVISAAGPLVAMAGGIPVAMLFGNGAGLPAMFLLASVLLIAFAVGYTRMARDVRSAGAFYAFAARGLGGIAAGATGMIALLSYNAIQIGLYGLFGSAAKALVEPWTGIALPWWAYSGAALVSVAWFGFRQVDLSAKVLGALVAAEYLVVVVLDVLIVGHGGDSGLSLRPFQPELFMAGSPAIGLMLCFAAFVGFEATTIYSEEARDPERTIPRATYFSVILIGVFYTISTWAAVNGVGVDKLAPLLSGAPDPTVLLFDLADRYAGAPMTLAMRVLFVTSTYAALLAFHNAISRYFFAMGREHLLPRRLGRTHPDFNSPHIGSVTQSALAAVCVVLFAVSGADPVLVVFTLLSAVATLGIIVLIAITSLSTCRHLLRETPPPTAVIAVSAVSLVVFGAVAALAVTRFDVLTGSAGAMNTVMPGSILVVALIGAGLAQRLRRRQPEAYARLGRSSDV